MGALTPQRSPPQRDAEAVATLRALAEFCLSPNGAPQVAADIAALLEGQADLAKRIEAAGVRERQLDERAAQLRASDSVLRGREAQAILDARALDEREAALMRREEEHAAAVATFGSERDAHLSRGRARAAA